MMGQTSSIDVFRNIPMIFIGEDTVLGKLRMIQLSMLINLRRLTLIYLRKALGADNYMGEDLDENDTVHLNYQLVRQNIARNNSIKTDHVGGDDV
jgi:hypothetical protein